MASKKRFAHNCLFLEIYISKVSINLAQQVNKHIRSRRLHLFNFFLMLISIKFSMNFSRIIFASFFITSKRVHLNFPN